MTLKGLGETLLIGMEIERLVCRVKRQLMAMLAVAGKDRALALGMNKVFDIGC